MRTYWLKCFIILLLHIDKLPSKSKSVTTIDTADLKTINDTGRNDIIITKKDDEKIKRNALYILKEFENDLNMLAMAPGMDSAEVNEMIRNRYLDEKRKIFYDSATIIEDDLWHTNRETAKKVQEKPIERYLSDFDIYYRKSDSASVIFSNMQVSNVKKADYLYIKVFYDCLFTGKPRFSDSPYVQSKKTAELKVERLGNRWRTWIINVHFLSPGDSINKNNNDVFIINEPVIESTPDTTKDEDLVVLTERSTATAMMDQAEKERIMLRHEAIRNEMAYKSLLKEADEAYQQNNYPIAYQKYQYALNIKPGEDYPKTMSEFAKKKFEQDNISPDQQYNQWIQKAKVAENKRRYKEAIECYNQALNVRSEEGSKQKILMLTGIIQTLVQAETRFNVGNFKGALQTYEKKSNEINPDFLLGQGKCYEKLNESKQAMKAYTAAIQLDPYYLEAYKSRAALWERNNDLSQALIDYTVCTTIDENDVELFVKIADVQKQLGNRRKAIEALDKAISIDSSKAILFHKKGEVFLQEKKFAEAMIFFNRTIQMDSTYALAYYYKGVCEVDIQRIADAGDDFAKARKLGIDHSHQTKVEAIADNFYKEGMIQYDKKKTDVAITLFSNAIHVNPGKEEYYFQKGACYIWLKEYDTAIQFFTKALQINPRFYDAYQQRGAAYFNVYKYKESIADLETATNKGSKLPQTYKLTGDSYFMIRAYSAAIRKYDTTLLQAKQAKITLEEDLLADLYNNRGECYFQLGIYTNALENFKTALRYKNDGRLYYNRGKTYMQLRLWDEAEQDLIKALSYQQKPLWNHILGQILQQKGQLEKAIQQYNKTLNMDPTHSLGTQTVYQRALCFVRLNRYPEALQDYQLIKSQKEENVYEHFENELGQIYLEVNEPDSALVSFHSALNNNPANADAAYGIAVAYVQKEQWDQSLPWFNKAFASGKKKRSDIINDKRIEGIRNKKPFKSLMKKYF